MRFNGVTRFFDIWVRAVILDPMLSHSCFVGKDSIALRTLAEAYLDRFLLLDETVDHFFVVAGSKTYPRRTSGIWMLVHNVVRYAVARRSSEVTIKTAIKPSRLISGVERLSAFNSMGLANVGPMRFT